MVCLRTALGALALYAVIRAQGGDALAALPAVRRRPGTALLFAALAIAIPFMLISVGEQHVPSGLTAVLIAAAPLFVAVFAPFLDRSEAVRGRQGAGLLLGMAGVALLVGIETVGTLAQFLSALGIVGAAASYTLSSFMVRRAYHDVPPLAISLTSVGGGALLTLAPAVLSPPDHWPRASSVAALVGLGVAGTAVAFVIFYRLIGELGPGRASLVSYLIPPLSLAYGALLLGERVTVAAIAGLALILAGVALAARRPLPAPEGGEIVEEATRGPVADRQGGGLPSQRATGSAREEAPHG